MSIVVAIVVVIAGVAMVVSLRPRGRERWVVVAQSPGHRPKASVRAHARLRRSGIPARLRSQGDGYASLIRGSAGASYVVLVREEDEEWARSVLDLGLDASGP